MSDKIKAQEQRIAKLEKRLAAWRAKTVGTRNRRTVERSIEDLKDDLYHENNILYRMRRKGDTEVPE